MTTVWGSTKPDKKAGKEPKQDKLADKKVLALELLNNIDHSISTLESIIERQYGSKKGQAQESKG